jgi:hypothetical protein
MKYTTESQRLDGGGSVRVIDHCGPSLAPSLAVVDPRWPVLVFYGLRWLASACIWPSLAVVGLCWPVLVFYGLHWLPLAIVGLCWLVLAI